jgi:hypothetical protein
MKTLKQLKKQKLEIEEQIEKLETETNLMQIPELNIEVTFMKEWTKPYNKIVCPNGFRMIKFSEVLFIWENEEYRNIFFKDYLKNPKWTAIACEQLWNDKINNYSRWVFLDRISNLGSYSSDLACSGDDGRVVFVREMK